MSDELIGWKLDFEVAKALGLPLRKDVWHGDGVFVGHGGGDLTPFAPSTDWAHGGPIIERERIATMVLSGQWRAYFVETNSLGNSNDPDYWLIEVTAEGAHASGPTLLIAAMRAFVASKGTK